MFSRVKKSANAASLQSALVRLQQWCADRQLTINTKKCYALHLGKFNSLGKLNSQKQYIVDGCCIDISQNVSVLGVEINSNLKYDTHIHNIIGKAYARVGVLFKGFASHSQHILRIYIYYVYIYHVCASSAWIFLKCVVTIFSKAHKCHRKVQKLFTKRVYSLSHLSYPERLASINLEPLKLCRLKNDLVMYYKCLNNLVALPSDDEYFCQQHHAS